METIVSQLESGLKDLPAGERLTVHLSSFSSDQLRQQDLTDLARFAPSDALKFLLTAERARVQQLTQQGLRKPKTLRLYVTYTVQSSTEGAQDVIKKLISRGETLWKSFTGELQSAKNQRLQTVLTKAFTDGFLQWEQVLSNKIGLTVRPLGAEELWHLLWQRFKFCRLVRVLGISISRIGIRTKGSAMSNISISLPDDLKAYVDEQIAKAGHASVSEYFLALVQREQQRNRAKETLDDLLTEGLDSLDRQEGIEATDEWWKQKRQNLIQQHQGQ